MLYVKEEDAIISHGFLDPLNFGLTSSQTLRAEPRAIDPMSCTLPPTHAVHTRPVPVSATTKFEPDAMLTIFSSDGNGSST